MRCLKNLLLLFVILFSQHTHAQWRPHAIDILPDSQRIASIDILNEATVWAVAYYDKTPAPVPADIIPKVLFTTDSGDNWTAHDIAEAQGRITQDIFAVDDNTAWITTNGLTANTQGLFKTTDGGQTWEEKLNDTSAGGLVHFFDENDGIVIHGKFMSTTTDGGETWNPVSIFDLPFEGDEDIFYRAGNNALAVQGNTLWFGTTFGRVFKSTDKGYTWEAFETLFEEEDVIVSTAFRNEQEGIIISYSKLIGLSIEFQEDTQISLTFDGGETWEMADTIYDFKINCMTVVPDEKITFMGATNGLSSFSKDTTSSWEYISYRPYNAIEFFTSELGWVGSGETSADQPAAMYKWDGVVTNTNDLLVETIGVKISPNPIHHQFQVEIADVDFEKHQHDNLEILIYDIFGKNILSQKINYKKEMIASTMPNGVYFYAIKSNQGILNSGKLIKQ